MSNKVNNLEKLLEELLSEADPVVRPTSLADFDAVPEQPSSVDQVIDRYFVQYEREAIPTSEIYESANLSDLTQFLLEQEEGGDLANIDLGSLGGGGEEEEASDMDLGGGDISLNDEPAPSDTGEKEPNVTPVVHTPRINLQDFARSVARLVNNVQSLIDLRSIILNRAEKYIRNNYNERTAKELMEILADTYDLKPVVVANVQNAGDKFPQPRTGVTGPMGG